MTPYTLAAMYRCTFSVHELQDIMMGGSEVKAARSYYCRCLMLALPSGITRAYESVAFIAPSRVRVLTSINVSCLAYATLRQHRECLKLIGSQVPNYCCEAMAVTKVIITSWAQ
jgi:hypothetical protein